MSEYDSNCLLLVEAGAEVPAWLDLAHIESLDQSYAELYLSFVERSAAWLRAHPAVDTVVVALCVTSTDDLEDRVKLIGSELVSALAGRPKARLLFGAPSDTPERQRSCLLNLTAQLVRDEERERPCVVGAHFSANSPSSSKISVQSN